MVPPMDPILGSPESWPIAPQQYQPRIGAPTPPPQYQRVAVIVHHGMGQQVPYETIEGVAKAIWSRAGQDTSDPVVRYARLGLAGDKDIESELVRAEVRLRAQVEHQQHHFDVHIYESYWAPLTEGQVNIRDVISFLKRAGWNGWLNTTAGTFRRWLFGSEREFYLPKVRLMAVLAGLLALVFALVFINSVLTAAAASHAIGSHSPFPSGTMLTTLTWDILLLDVAGVAFALGIFFFGTSRFFAIRVIGWIMIYTGALIIVLGAVLMAIHLIGVAWPWSFSASTGWPQFQSKHQPIVVIILLLPWALELGAAAGVRWALIEYVGDVTAYIAPYSVSKFWRLRQDIRDVAMKVTRAVYRARNVQGNDFLYNKIIVVGHSLGSVICYDALNAMLLEAALSREPLRVPERTRMFLTFGSPLDKTAFLFRTLKDMHSPVREVGAAAVQPMIADYANRPQEWVNLWSRADIISGHLDYYDRPSPENAKDKATARALPPLPPQHQRKPVNNRIDDSATTPLKAHVEYWGGAAFAQELVRGITTV